jgi:hypothetical protein
MLPSEIAKTTGDTIHAAAHVIPFLAKIGESYRVPAIPWTVMPDGEIHGQPADTGTAHGWARALDQRLHDTGQRGVWAVSSPGGIADVTVRLTGTDLPGTGSPGQP